MLEISPRFLHGFLQKNFKEFLKKNLQEFSLYFSWNLFNNFTKNFYMDFLMVLFQRFFQKIIKIFQDYIDMNVLLFRVQLIFIRNISKLDALILKNIWNVPVRLYGVQLSELWAMYRSHSFCCNSIELGCVHLVPRHTNCMT